MVDIAQGNPISILLTHPGLTRLFAGTAIPTGPFQLTMDKVCFSDPHATMERYRELPLGSEMQVKWKPLVAPRAKLLNLRT